MTDAKITTDSNEPPLKVARHELRAIHENNSGQSDKSRGFATLFIRSTKMLNRGDLVNEFLGEHRASLGIQDWFSEEGTLRTDAPVECVFVKTSRKPYFLLEFMHEGDSAISTTSIAALATERLKALSQSSYKGHPVIIMEARDGLTVAEERKKLELRDAVRRSTTTTKDKGESNSSSSKPSSATTFVPRVLRKR